MTPAFWDTSGLVPLCVNQRATAAVQELLVKHSIVVWWSASVEMRSAFERLLRMNELTVPQYKAAGHRLDQLRRSWREMQPSEAVRMEAEKLLGRYPLKAADSLQLAAAWIWSEGLPHDRVFIAGDTQLLDAAKHLGFLAESV